MVSVRGQGQQTLFSPPYRYIIDTCSILSQKPDRTHRRHVYKTLWDNVEGLIEAGVIVTCSEIWDEVEDRELRLWLQRIGCVILAIDQLVQQNLETIVNDHPKLLCFVNQKSSGDAFLIATAMAYKIAVITEEEKTSPKKIPKVCEAYSIPCYNLTELSELEGWTF